MSESTSTVREKLRAEVVAVCWEELAPHCVRGGLLLVAPQVDLLDAAEALARDDRSWVEQMLEAGLFGRASQADAQRFEAEKTQRFQCVIVQPFVVAQPILASDESVHYGTVPREASDDPA